MCSQRLNDACLGKHCLLHLAAIPALQESEEETKISAAAVAPAGALKPLPNAGAGSDYSLWNVFNYKAEPEGQWTITIKTLTGGHQRIRINTKVNTSCCRLRPRTTPFPREKKPY